MLGIERMVREGGGATRQRERVLSSGIDGLCDWLADETIERVVQPSENELEAVA